ncbi:uncharacterized protein LOC131439121 isoform X2 [Malaya genurostris]|uniref:uncharacterized protein LOC131439121 isoform X2 n=1 Tax=Malaya genurostris TaxID=325434 RepID=UPI0026F3E9FD|nr:uncharacterized protein LOC131439121 isoform X2 [Malaya genurostris]
MSDKLAGGGRYNRISPSSGRGSIIAYSPLPKSEQDCIQAPGNNCLAIPLSAIQTDNNIYQKSAPPPPIGTVGQKGIGQNPHPVPDGVANKHAGKRFIIVSDIKKTELRCTPISGFQFPPQTPPVSIATTNIITNTTSTDGAVEAAFAQQPLIDRRLSSSMMRNWWGGSPGRKSDLAAPATARQVSFGGQPGTGGFVSSRSEPISLATLDKDCFIIPVHSLDRFLPAGIPLPTPETTDPSQVGPLSVLEVSDPKICILAHLMSPLEPIDPLLESPLAHPLTKQRAVASELLNEIQQANNAVSGMLLANMERSSAEFPFIAYYVINTTQTDPTLFYTGVRGASLSKFEPKNTRYTAAHTLDLYSEVASICRPPLALAPNEMGSIKKGQTPSTGYIISVYKVYEGDDGERFERNWLYWTGARMIYRYLPKTAGLRRITLHKSVSPRGDKMYLLVCECADLLKDLSAAALLIPALRARLCGYTGLYRPIQTF